MYHDQPVLMRAGPPKKGGPRNHQTGGSGAPLDFQRLQSICVAGLQATNDAMTLTDLDIQKIQEKTKPKNRRKTKNKPKKTQKNKKTKNQKKKQKSKNQKKQKTKKQKKTKKTKKTKKPKHWTRLGLIIDCRSCPVLWFFRCFCFFCFFWFFGFLVFWFFGFLVLLFFGFFDFLFFFVFFGIFCFSLVFRFWFCCLNHRIRNQLRISSVQTP